jgi:hypothetical protein
VKFKPIIFLYSFLLIVLGIFSYGFVDPNLKLGSGFFYQDAQKKLAFLVYQQRLLTTLIFIFLVLFLFTLYFFLLNLADKGELSAGQLFKLVIAAVLILFFAYPAFSHDIFNYIMTAKIVTFYHENPYIVMPMEFLGEPMLAFMHAANKLALYAPFWIVLTLVPSVLARGNILASIFLFKFLIIAFYLGTVFLIGKILGQINPRRKIAGTVFFAFNPLVLIETLVSAHNDVVMMFFTLLGFYLLFQKKRFLSFVSLLASAGIKYATIILLPLFAFPSRLKKEKLIILSSWALFLVFFLAPLREEIYSWYLIWIIALVALVTQNRLLYWLAISFSLGLLLRYTPFLYTRSWEGVTPLIKKIVTIIPPSLVLISFFFKQIAGYRSIIFLNEKKK